jgi:hypothetical protein
MKGESTRMVAKIGRGDWKRKYVGQGISARVGYINDGSYICIECEERGRMGAREQTVATGAEAWFVWDTRKSKGRT